MALKKLNMMKDVPFVILARFQFHPLLLKFRIIIDACTVINLCYHHNFLENFLLCSNPNFL